LPLVLLPGTTEKSLAHLPETEEWAKSWQTRKHMAYHGI